MGLLATREVEVDVDADDWHVELVLLLVSCGRARLWLSVDASGVAVRFRCDDVPEDVYIEGDDCTQHNRHSTAQHNIAQHSTAQSRHDKTTMA